MEPTHPDKLVENVTAPSAISARILPIRIRRPFRMTSSSLKVTEFQDRRLLVLALVRDIELALGIEGDSLRLVE